MSAVSALTASVLLVGFVAACSSQPAATAPNSAAVVSSLGAVPIPSVPTGTPAPVTASVGHPQLVAMGAPVEVSLADGTRALLVTSGPTVDLPPGQVKPNGPVPGVITLTVTPSTGSLRLSAADLGSRDQSGSAVALTPIGPAAVSVSPGHPATLRVSGTFHQGDAQINWQQGGHVLAIWDFTIETD